jgi:hypothetical protein
MSDVTMRTVEVITYGEFQWNGPEHAARIERARVFFSDENKVREMLKFCYTNNGRHARTHLTIDQEDFVELFDSAMENNVFRPEVLRDIYKLLKKRFD